MSPSPLPPPPVKNETIGRSRETVQLSSYMVLKALVECAQLVESKTNEIMKSMVKFKDSVSEDGESVEQVGFYFVEGFLAKLF